MRQDATEQTAPNAGARQLLVLNKRETLRDLAKRVKRRKGRKFQTIHYSLLGRYLQGVVPGIKWRPAIEKGLGINYFSWEQQ